MRGDRAVDPKTAEITKGRKVLMKIMSSGRIKRNENNVNENKKENRGN
jgi:hypothetical protein